MLAPKSNPKLIPTWKIDFLKNRRFSLGKTMILKVQGTEVGSKNQSKIHEKMKSRWEGVLGSVFHRFWWVWKAKLAGQTELRERAKTRHDRPRKASARQEAKTGKSSHVKSGGGKFRPVWVTLVWRGRGLPYLKGGDLEMPPLSGFFFFDFSMILGTIFQRFWWV